jgi:glycosyltransferase involved in cell wall biosynthesis
VRAEQLGVSHLLTLTGTLSHAEALVALRKARLCLFPSLWEGLPITPMEAMFFGVPVVASKVGGTDEVVVDGETGVLIDGFCPATYAAAIRTLLADPLRLKRLAENGRRRVEALFDRRICSARYAELYARVGRATGPGHL